MTRPILSTQVPIRQAPLDSGWAVVQTRVVLRSRDDYHVVHLRATADGFEHYKTGKRVHCRVLTSLFRYRAQARAAKEAIHNPGLRHSDYKGGLEDSFYGLS